MKKIDTTSPSVLERERFRVSRRAALVAVGASALLPLKLHAQSSDWPTRPVKMIVAWPPGGPADAIGRQVARQLEKRLGQPVVVENRSGASGRIGAAAVARAEPDGYTMLFSAPSELTIAAATVSALQYDPIRDFEPVMQVATSTFMLIAAANFPPNSVSELIAYTKANPGKVNYASYGEKTLNHLFGLKFSLAAGIDPTHVPYKGGGPALADLIGGQVQLMFENVAQALPHIKAGKIKPIAVMSSARVASLPDVPTLIESGVRIDGVGSWNGLLVPAKTPKPIVDRLYADMIAILASPEMVKVLDDRGMVAGNGTPADFAKLLRTETEGYKQVVTRLGLKLD